MSGSIWRRHKPSERLSGNIRRRHRPSGTLALSLTVWEHPVPSVWEQLATSLTVWERPALLPTVWDTAWYRRRLSRGVRCRQRPSWIRSGTVKHCPGASAPSQSG
ncbi:hypothetical protein DPMN_148103 [Dreissena polymorpha]|uniref:Uncharacterized protein n=1 Tax=Dreissena polymorpha TaxID=45954 RepID=A0A9D4FB34_DREPO|nr:hypothetical protein DPMN_148103 [Dreissena polymorpha]